MAALPEVHPSRVTYRISAISAFQLPPANSPRELGVGFTYLIGDVIPKWKVKSGYFQNCYTSAKPPSHNRVFIYLMTYIIPSV